MAFNNTVIGRAAASIWGLKLGNATMNAVLAQANTTTGGINALVNQTFNTSFGTTVTTAGTDALATSFVANLGLTGQAATDGKAYVIAQLATTAAGDRGSKLLEIANLFAGLATDPVYGSFANAFNTRVAQAVNYSATAGTVDSALNALDASFSLSTRQDAITGTIGNDVFNAYIFDNSNTLQSGDFVDGGAGVDTLYADMGASQNFAVTPITRNVENIVIRGESRATDTGDNNVFGEGRVNIDAERIQGASRYESNNSRADVIIEDIRLTSSQLTKDVTIAMVDTDPGHVDFGAYIELKSVSVNTSQLRLQIIDQKAAAEGGAPLRDSPFDGFRINFLGVDRQFTSTAIQNAQTYAEFLAAVQAQLALDTNTAGRVTAALGGTFSVLSAGGITVTGTEIVLTSTAGALGVGNWIALGGVPSNSDTFTNMLTGSSSANDLITSTIVLDNVGRGSTGGDLVVGGLAVGETSTQGIPTGPGVDRFEITVERTSRLQNIDSTNNVLKEVTFKNGAVNGNVVVNGFAGNNSSTENNALPGTDSGTGNTHDDWGFNDVRLIDASAMVGSVTFDAVITANSFSKYFDSRDTSPNPGDDNTSQAGKTVQRPDFIYSGGAGGDSMTVRIDSGVVNSSNTVLVGREDASFRFNGNAGNDSMTISINNGSLVGFGQPGSGALYNGLADVDSWYAHQQMLRNITIDGGDGNDTIRKPGAGDADILGGAGSDTIYVENTGSAQLAGAGVARAQWVFNTQDQDTAAAAGAGVDDARQFGNIMSSTLSTYQLYKATVQVQFLGTTGSTPLVSSRVVIASNPTTYRSSDLQINQAIKQAINNDPVLNKLLVAEDGPGFTLIVTSLIDGARVVDNLRLDFAATTDTLTAAELTGINAAWDGTAGVPYADSAAAVAAMLVTANALEAADYDNALTHNNGIESTGANGALPSDNRITGGAGNDVIVLGTFEGASVNLSDNDRVIYNGAFDNDTIVNFDINGNGIDRLDFTALGGVAAELVAYDAVVPPAAPAYNLNNGAIYREVLDLTAGSFNDTAAEVAALFLDTQGAVATTTKTMIYIAVNELTNVGTVYQVVDAPGASANVTATLMGTIDLADVTWASLGAGNFV